MSTIIGFNNGIHDSGVALIQDGVIKAMYAEERFSNIKMKGGAINLSLKSLLEDYSINLDSVDYFVTSTSYNLINEDIDLLKKYHHKIQYYPHQYCHAISALLFSPFYDKNDVMVLTLDGGDFNIFNLTYGENICDKINDWIENTKHIGWWKKSKNNVNISHGSLSIYKDGKITNVKQFQNNFGYLFLDMGSILMWYIYNIRGTNLEGKIMGLSSKGKYNDVIYKTFRSLCYFNKEHEYFENHTSIGLNVENNFIHGRIQNELVELIGKYPVEDMCYNLQKCVEDACLELIQFYQEKYKCKYICLSGGFFANVKTNQLINEKLDFEEIFVMPAMNDEGISMGAALAKCVDLGEYKFDPIKDVYLGKGYSKNDIDYFVKNNCKNYIPFDFNFLIDNLKNGKIVGVFRGRTEFGPRALGNRSILVDPSNRQTFSILNDRLQRHEIMPFAPIILDNRVNDILYCDKSKRSAEFMTLCYNVKPDWISRIPAVINIYDNTCRPQIVTKKTNDWLHTLLEKYDQIHGLPVLLNTSFNTHGFPIINTPNQALTAFKEKVIDMLVIEDYIIY
jgi:carbamoyltransferase